MFESLFKVIEFTPLWKSQKEDDETLILTLPIGLAGLVFTFFIVEMLVISNITIDIIGRASRQTNSGIIILGNIFAVSALGVMISGLTILLLSKFSATFSNINFIEEYHSQRTLIYESYLLENIDQLSDEELRNNSYRDFNVELGLVFILGLLSGVYFSILYFIPMYLLFLFLILIFVNFISFTGSILLSQIIAWLLITIRLVILKMRIEEQEEFIVDPHSEYALSDRKADIIASNEPPIICLGCRSYIAANSKICNICGDSIVSE